MIFDKQVALKPDYYPWTRDFIDAMWKGHWTPEEFSFHGDYNDYKQNIDDQQRQVVRNTLSAIGQIEIAVKTFWTKLGENLPHPSLNDLGITMANIEVIHNRAYVKLLDVLHLDHIFEENLRLPVIEGRVSYLRKYTEKHYANSRQQYVYALILFTAIIENVSLFSQFYTINSFNKAWKLFKDADQQVKYTAKEEMSHALAGVRIVNQIREEHPELFDNELNDHIMQEMTDAVGMETRIIDWMLGDYTAKFQGQDILNRDILVELVKSRINDSMKLMHFQPVHSINQEVLQRAEWFDVEILGGSKTDFFHKRPSDYTNLKGVTGSSLFKRKQLAAVAS